MTDKTLEDLQNLETLLHKQHDDGIIPDNEYYKCLVSLSYEYFADGDVTTGLALLAICDHDYFRGVQLMQMKEDRVYQAMVIYIAERLIEKGVASLYDVPPPTQAPAKA